MTLIDVYKRQDAVTTSITESFQDTVNLSLGYIHAIPEYMFEVAIALSPIIIFFLIFQLVARCV